MFYRYDLTVTFHDGSDDSRLFADCEKADAFAAFNHYKEYAVAANVVELTLTDCVTGETFDGLKDLDGMTKEDWQEYLGYVK